MERIIKDIDLTKKILQFWCQRFRHETNQIMKKIQVYSTIVLVLVYALTAPLLRPSFDLFWLLLTVVAILALLAKNYLDLFLVAFLGINMIAHTLLYPGLTDLRHIAQVTALTALNYLHITLLMGPLAKLSKRFAPYLKHRRHVGVSVFLLAFVHANFIIAQYYNFNIENMYGVTSNFFGTTALMILSVMALTSMNYFQHKMSLKSYNLIHTGFLLFYVFYVVMLNVLGLLRFETWQLVFVFAFIIFWLATAPWTLPRKLFLRVNGWKQLHYLVYIAYIAVVIHAWTGYFVVEEKPMQVFFWVWVVLVVCVHIYGWIVRFRNSRKLKQKLEGTA